MFPLGLLWFIELRGAGGIRIFHPSPSQAHWAGGAAKHGQRAPPYAPGRAGNCSWSPQDGSAHSLPFATRDTDFRGERLEKEELGERAVTICFLEGRLSVFQEAPLVCINLT